jgi:hypothetical protein
MLVNLANPEIPNVLGGGISDLKIGDSPNMKELTV